MRPDAIDLRTDTKTLPTDAMLEAIRHAPLGDAKANEDPTVLRLEAMAAEVMGTEAAMLVISGTQANLCALTAHAVPGGAFVTDPDSHVYYYEGAHTAVAGLRPLLVESRDGLIDPDDLAAVVERHRRAPSLLCLENTHNRGGGRVVPVELHNRLCEVAHRYDMTVHVDGARIFNAAVAAGVPAAAWTEHADSIMFCLSKSLSCPLGSVLCGSEMFIAKAKQTRARLGGGMRQAGVIAAPGIVALESMVDRLAADHALARRLAEAVSQMPGLAVDMATVQTNMVNVRLTGPRTSPADWVEAFREQGVLVGTHAPDRLRLVTHRHHTPESIDEAIRRLRWAAEEA